MNQNLLLIGYIVPLLVGVLLMTPAGASLFGNFLKGRNPLMIHQRRRHMLGMNLVALVGFVVSVHTLWITNKISEGGNVCSTSTVFSCDDVLGNSAYNTDPVFGLSWGLVGMFAFASLLFITNAVSKEPDALWSERYLRYGKLMTGGGLAVIALLVYYEIQMGKICQFCTMAHIANVVCLFGFWRAGKMHDEGTWNDITPEEAKGDSAA